MRNRRKLIQGVGINDADYTVSKSNGWKCPFYKVWQAMIDRCYSKRIQDIYPTYKGSSVCVDWLTFSSFKRWMENQDWKGKQLDKDILIQGNKLYSPETCLFVKESINNLFTVSKAIRGKYPIGVTRCGNKYRSQCSVNGSIHRLGSFSTADQAHEAYKEFKYKVIADEAENQEEPLRSAMLKYKISKST